MFDKYDSYVDSELRWLSEVPSKWNVKRIKDVTLLKYSNVDKRKYDNQEDIQLCNYTDVYKNEFITSKINFMKATASKEEIKKFTIKKDDVLFTKDSESFDDNANPCLINENFTNVVCGYHLAQIRANKKDLIGKYLFRLFQSINYNYYFSVNSKGITRVGLGIGAVSNAKLFLPPLKTQITIATYLDTQTQKIDKEIQLLEKKSLKYKELKQTLINKTVLNGIKSGVIFETKRLKDFITYTIGGEVIDVSYWDSGNELTYTAGKNPVLSNFNKFPNRKRTTKNDILIARNGDGFVHIPKLNSMFTNVVQLVRLSKKVDIKFIWYCLEDIKFKINRMSNGDFIASLNKEMWFNSFLNIPPLEEQIKIATYLDEKTKKIDNITKTIKTKITLLKEFRKTLINDTVTGKIKVA